MNNRKITRTIARVLCLIVGGWWFVPVSFTAGFWASVVLGSYLTAWHADTDSEPNYLFFVLAKIPDQEEIKPVRLRKLQDFQQEFPTATFVLPSAEGFIKKEHSEGDNCSCGWHYQMTQQNPDELKIEIAYSDMDYLSTSVYRVSRHAPASVTPIYARIMGPGSGMFGLPGALIFAWLLHRLAMRAYRKLSENSSAGQSS
jgi:hypothetical protein